MAFQDLMDTASQIYNIFSQPRETPAPIQEGPTGFQTTATTAVPQQPAAPIQPAGPAVPGMMPGLGGTQQRTAPLNPQEQQQAELFRQQDLGLIPRPVQAPIAPQPPVQGGVQYGQLPPAGEGAFRSVRTGMPVSPEIMARQQPPAPEYKFDPQQAFSRILGIESNNRHRDERGNLIRSAKGAVGIAQIMPSTAANPGYGLKPLTQAELEDEGKNRQFGNNYFNAMVKQFNGDVEKGVAAYNAGEGGVKRAMFTAAQQGQPQNWRQFLPNETQAYLKKVLGPLAQQQRTAAQPQAAAVSGQPATPAQAPAVLPGIPNPQQMQQFDQVMNSNDPAKMMQFMDQAPDWQRKLLQYQMADTIQLGKQKEEAKQVALSALQSGDSRELEKGLKDRSIGHLILGYLATALSPELGRQIASEGGWFNKYGTVDMDGQMVAYRQGADGRVLQAVYTSGERQGQDLNKNDLRRIYGEVPSPGEKPAHVTKVESKIDPETRQEVSVQTLSNGRQKYLAGGRSYAGDKAVLVDRDDFVTAENQKVAAAYRKLESTTQVPTEQQRLDALMRAGVHRSRIEKELGMPDGSLKSTVPAAGAKGQAPSAGVAAGTQQFLPANTTTIVEHDPNNPPKQQPGEPNTEYAARKSKWENTNKLQAKDAQGFAEKRQAVASNLRKFRDAIGFIDSGEHNLGPTLGTSGAGPFPQVQQFGGRLIGTKASSNTQDIVSLITRGGLEGIRENMGPVISNFDVEQWLKSNPIDERSSPEAIKKWLVRTHNTLLAAAEDQKKVAVRHGLMEPSFNIGSPIAETGQAWKIVR